MVHSGTRGKHNYLSLTVQPVQDDQPIGNTQLKSSGHFLTKLSFGHRDKAIKIIDVTR